jgi:hypothetical protein
MKQMMGAWKLKIPSSFNINQMLCDEERPVRGQSYFSVRIFSPENLLLNQVYALQWIEPWRAQAAVNTVP